MPGVLRLLSTANRWVELGARVKAREQVNPLELVDLGLHTLFGEETARDVKRQGSELLSTLMFGSDGGELAAPGYDGVPWATLARLWDSAPFCVVVIVGDPGSGKTRLLVKRAAKVHFDRGWPVDILGFYPEDEPGFARHISMQRLIARIRKVLKFVNQETIDDIGDGLTEAEIRGKKPIDTAARITQREIDLMKHRFVGVDEAGAFFSALGAAGQSETRDASKRWADAIRHLESHLFFISQQASDVPGHVKASALMVYKWASQGVIEQDFRDGTKRSDSHKWELAITMLRAVKTGSFVEPLPTWMTEVHREAIYRAAQCHERFWIGPLADIRAWGVAMGKMGDPAGPEILTVFPSTIWMPPGLLAAGRMDE